jgi:hypothetical protein
MIGRDKKASARKALEFPETRIGDSELRRMEDAWIMIVVWVQFSCKKGSLHAQRPALERREAWKHAAEVTAAAEQFRALWVAGGRVPNEQLPVQPAATSSFVIARISCVGRDRRPWRR